MRELMETCDICGKKLSTPCDNGTYPPRDVPSQM